MLKNTQPITNQQDTNYHSTKVHILAFHLNQDDQCGEFIFQSTLGVTEGSETLKNQLIVH